MYYSPVRHFTTCIAAGFSCDLHVLGTPPAFVLSQNQTLQRKFGAHFKFYNYSLTQIEHLKDYLLLEIVFSLSKKNRVGTRQNLHFHELPASSFLIFVICYLVFKDRKKPTLLDEGRRIVANKAPMSIIKK